MKQGVLVVAISVCALFGTRQSVWAQGSVPTAEKAQSSASGKSPTPESKTATVNSGDTSQNTGDQLRTLGFGTALGVRWNVFDPQIVTAASVDANGFVRVDTRADTAAGFVFELHALPVKWDSGRFGFGPFIAAELGSTQIVSGAGLGLMFGVQVGGSTKGLGFGLGYMALPAVKVLGDEFKEGQLAPKGPDGKSLPIRLQTRDKGSLMFIASFVF